MTASKEFVEDIEACLKVLKEGGIILYPTDTIWGIGCDATNAAAVEKIIFLKQRPEDKSFVVLVASEREVLKYVASLDLAVFDYLQQTTKPTTVVYENAIGLAENVLAADGSVAIRICKDEFCRHLIKRFGKPIVSTSANISSQPSPGNFDKISLEVRQGVDYVVKQRQYEGDKISTPSSIIQWIKDKAVILRP
jgi:L-threonylcarbamoyladenylate synthase